MRWTARRRARADRPLGDGLLLPAALGVLFVAYLTVPMVAFLARAGSGDVLGALADPSFRRAVAHSAMTAPVATAIATVLGVPLGYVLARGRFPGRGLLQALVLLPLVVPPVVGGAMLLALVGRFTPLGSLAAAAGIPLTDSLVGVVLAQTFVAGPFVVVTARAGFGAVDPRYEEAARALGHGPLATFRRISLPLAGRAILAGVVLTFARAVGEFGATLMVAYNPRTMPTQLWVAFLAEGIEGVVPLALALLLLTLVVVGVVALLGPSDPPNR